MAESFLLDTSAFIAFLQAEPGAPRVRDLLEQATRHEVRVSASFASLTEVQYITTQDFGAPAAHKTIADLQAMTLGWVHSDAALCAAAAELKGRHKLSFADAFVAASALRLDAVLVHKDPEFAPLAPQLKQEMLPPKVSAAKTT